MEDAPSSLTGFDPCPPGGDMIGVAKSSRFTLLVGTKSPSTKLREEKVDFISFIYPDFEGTVCDFKIGDKKVQEKVGFICKNNPNSFGFSLNKSDGKKYNCSYKLGDNDFYWLHCKNTTRFYVIPETILIEKGFIGDNCKEHLYISPTNINTKWTDEYLFNYDNIDKERLLELLELLEK